MMHKELFAAYLEAVHREKPSIYRKVAAMVPKNLSYNIDGRELSARELLLTKDIEGADLVATEFYNTVLEGADAYRCVRNAVPFFKMNTDVMNVPYGETTSEASTPVAEGAEIPIDVQAYNKATFTAKKYAKRPVITTEMIEDSKYDVIALEVSKTGRALELGLNKLMIDELIADKAGNSGDCGGSGVNTLSALSSAINNVDSAGFKADTAILCPGAWAAYRTTLAGTGTYTPNQTLISGNLPATLMGLKAFQSGHTPATVTNWRFTTNDDVAGIVFDSKACGGVGMRKDLTVEQYKDPIHDLVGCSVLMRYDVQAFVGASIAAIIY